VHRGCAAAAVCVAGEEGQLIFDGITEFSELTEFFEDGKQARPFFAFT
jgi:hypothetical protein